MVAIINERGGHAHRPQGGEGVQRAQLAIALQDELATNALKRLPFHKQLWSSNKFVLVGAHKHHAP